MTVIQRELGSREGQEAMTLAVSELLARDEIGNKLLSQLRNSARREWRRAIAKTGQTWTETEVLLDPRLMQPTPLNPGLCGTVSGGIAEHPLSCDPLLFRCCERREPGICQKQIDTFIDRSERR